jgi:TusE/DsrC/DsvC family sulfur relay protein
MKIQSLKIEEVTMATWSTAVKQAVNTDDSFVANPQFDEYGFLVAPELWSENVAVFIAELDGIGPLGSEHWDVIYFLRDRYLRLGAIPPLRNLCRGAGLSRNRLKALFGSCRMIWRIAGLPDPGEEVRNHFM